MVNYRTVEMIVKVFDIPKFKGIVKNLPTSIGVITSVRASDEVYSEEVTPKLIMDKDKDGDISVSVSNM